MSKLTVEIDLENHFHEEDGELAVSELVNNAISYEVRIQLAKLMRTEVNREVTNAVNASLKGLLTESFATSITKRLEGSIRSLTFDIYGKRQTIGNWIQQNIANILTNKVNDRLDRKIQNTVKDQINLLEQQYNSNFATEIISKLKEGGFLSEKAEHILLTKEEQK